MQQNSTEKFPGIELGAVWYSTKTPGVMSGKIGNARCLIIPNKNKEGQQPDARIFLMPRDENQQQQRPQQQNQQRDNLPF